MNTVEYTLPTYLNTAIMYGDYSGLNDEEYKQLIIFTNDENLGHCIDIKDDSCFHTNHDYNPEPLPGECCTYVFEVKE